MARLGPAATQFGGVSFTTPYQPEHDMKTSRIWFLRALSGGLSLAALTLAFAFDGSRAVRAEEAEVLPPSLQETIVGPIMKTVQGFEQRIASIEATVADFADSFTSRRIAAELLCVSDQSGAQTCITKAQLDSLLGKLAQAEVVQPQPPVTVTEAVAPPEELTKITTAADPTPAADPAKVQGGENPLPDQEPEHTGAEGVQLQPRVTVTEAVAPPAELTKITTAADPTPAADPANVQAENSLPDQEPEHTGAEGVQPQPRVTVTEAVAPAELAKITTATDPTPAADPANVQAENPLPDQEPEHTGAVRSASSGTAVVSDSEEEISVAVPAPPSDE
jgi:hypothetical protein